jgi:hypothetical protein
MPGRTVPRSESGPLQILSNAFRLTDGATDHHNLYAILDGSATGASA